MDKSDYFGMDKADYCQKNAQLLSEYDNVKYWHRSCKDYPDKCDCNPNKLKTNEDEVEVEHCNNEFLAGLENL